MSWIRSAMNKAAEVPGGAIFRAAVRTYADSFVQHAGYSVSGAARMFQDRIAPRNLKSFSEAARMLEEASVSCKGEERVQLLRRWLVALRAFERLDGSFVEIDGKSCEDPSSPSDKNDTPGKSTMIVYYDPDLGSLPMNFRDVFLQSQTLEGITMSMILGAPNEEEISLIHEIFGLCLAGGKEVHDVVVKNIQELAKAFSVYDVEMLVRREELLQFAQTAITGLKVSGDIARIDSEISQIQQRLNRIKSEDSESSSESTSNASSKDIEEPVTHIQLCCRLKSLLLKKRLLRIGDTIETHTQKVDILKVLIESLHNSASKTEKRILEHREEKKEALTFRVARTDEVSQIEKDVGAEISVLEKQRDKLEAELREVNNTLAAAYTRLQNAREERFQFDEDNNDFLLLLKEKEEELSMTIVSYKAEADTCHAFVNFLEATWTFQSSYVEQRDKQVNDQLQDHEVYFVNATSSFLSTYKDQLSRAIANVRRLEESVKGFRKIIDPDDEFLQDIKQREKVEQEYLDAEAKVISIFDAVETIKEYFYSTIDDPSRKGIEAITALFEAIEYFKSDFRSIKRPNLMIEKLTEGEDSTSPGSPQGVMVPPPIRVMPDFKSIFAQKLLIKSPRQKPYVPLGGSPENSPVSTMGYNAMSAETEQLRGNIFESEKPSHHEQDVSDIALEFEDETMRQKTTTKSDQESSDEIPKLPLTAEESGVNNDTTENVCGETSQFSTGGYMKSVDSNEEPSTSRIEKEMSTN